MIGLDVRMDERSTRFLDGMAKTYPKELHRAFVRAASIVSRRIRGAMTDKPRRRGAVKVERWSDFTREYRSTLAAESRRTFGGMLCYPDKKRQIVAIPEGRDRVRVGWIGSMESYAVKFQEASAIETEAWWRRSLYSTGRFKHGEVPRTADTPARPVIELATADAAANYERWVIGAFAKLMEQKAAKLDYSKDAATREGYLAAARSARALEVGE